MIFLILRRHKFGQKSKCGRIRDVFLQRQKLWFGCWFWLSALAAVLTLQINSQATVLFQMCPKVRVRNRTTGSFTIYFLPPEPVSVFQRRSINLPAREFFMGEQLTDFLSLWLPVFLHELLTYSQPALF